MAAAVVGGRWWLRWAVQLARSPSQPVARSLSLPGRSVTVGCPPSPSTSSAPSSKALLLLPTPSSNTTTTHHSHLSHLSKPNQPTNPSAPVAPIFLHSLPFALQFLSSASHIALPRLASTNLAAPALRPRATAPVTTHRFHDVSAPSPRPTPRQPGPPSPSSRYTTTTAAAAAAAAATTTTTHLSSGSLCLDTPRDTSRRPPPLAPKNRFLRASSRPRPSLLPPAACLARPRGKRTAAESAAIEET
ncbi:hypothetical protein CDD83_10493 [Cordyceps sp. RAO-2017]|nr:hypothetical protein CDD83_10493 [Cordyceps sp. RAO-2017]